MDPARVFTYGSLMYLPVWERVTGGGHPALHGSLRGFARKRVAGASYPALVLAHPERVVPGILYLDVSPADLRALDHFEAEGELYERTRVKVELEDQRMMDAWAYVYLLAEHVEAADWDPARFERDDLHHFLRG